MDALGRIVAMLSDESPRKRIAAAVVLGELGMRSPSVVAPLSKMAREELSALAEPAIEALGKLGARSALPVLVDALERRDLAKAAAAAIASLGEEALPALREQLETASPQVRARLSEILPSVRGSFATVLSSLRGQPWEAVNRTALSLRQSARAASPAERKSMAKQAAAFLGKARDDEPALRGAIKILGYLELPETAAAIEPYLAKKHPPAVRVEAVTALRFALLSKPDAKALRGLVALLEDADALVARAARDTLTVVPGVPPAELARLSSSAPGELALWAIERLRALGAAKELARIASSADRTRAEAAVRALASLPGTGPLLAGALADAEEEAAARALSQALEQIKLSAKELSRLRTAGAASLRKSFALGRQQLDPLRRVDGQAWAQTLREAARKSSDPARSEAILELLARSSAATPEDRYAHASLLLRRSALDPHPRARQADPALAELEKLAADGFALVAAMEADRALGEPSRYHAAFHLVEHAAAEVRAQGVALLEAIAARGRSKLSRAARNKLSLLRA